MIRPPNIEAPITGEELRKLRREMLKLGLFYQKRAEESESPKQADKCGRTALVLFRSSEVFRLLAIERANGREAA